MKDIVGTISTIHPPIEVASETTPNYQEALVNTRLLISYTDIQRSYIVITVPLLMTEAVFNQAALGQQQSIKAHGFIKGGAPMDYVKNNFKESLLEHVKEFLLKYEVIPFLYKNFRTKKLLVVGSPRLMDISLTLDKHAEFTFEFVKVSPIVIENWKYYPFKAPKRKNYKDIDRQVESFLTYEKEQLTKHSREKGIQLNDWVSFGLALVGQDQALVFNRPSKYFWFKLNPQDGEGTLRDIFIGKQPGETFYTNDAGLQEYFSSDIETNYLFCIHIEDFIPHTYFCIEQFKTHFRLKTNKEVHQKLIEVFSFRNDVCLRRSMVEETFKLLMAKHPFYPPEQLVERQAQMLMETVQDSPDYNVYRVQKDFRRHIRELAQRQVKEEILVDQFACYENFTASDYEIKNYLSFFNRARMKEFIYFEFPPHKVQGQEAPIATDVLRKYCLSEKTINYIIYHLTKK